jgi:hypothetical protein
MKFEVKVNAASQGQHISYLFIDTAFIALQKREVKGLLYV